MSTIVPHLVNAASFGAVVGVGSECITNFNSKGALLLASVVGAVALGAIAFLFNEGTAVGALVGIVVSVIYSRASGREQSAINLFGSAVLGGAAGCLLHPGLAKMNFVLLV